MNNEKFEWYNVEKTEFSYEGWRGFQWGDYRPEWRVLRRNLDTNEIEVYDIFDNEEFTKDCDYAWLCLRKRDYSYKDLDVLIMEHFDIMDETDELGAAIPFSYYGIENGGGIYDQVMMNWDAFMIYVYNYYKTHFPFSDEDWLIYVPKGVS